MINIILCGGSGTRLWPISRTLLPKQFVKLFSGHSLFQDTVERNAVVCHGQYVVSNAAQHFLALDQLEELQKPNQSFLLEPVGRNTAPAIALACLTLHADDIVLVTPSDHLIKNREAYTTALGKAQKLAQDGFLVTFGIQPTYAETGFGYIEAEGELVKAFKEKPDAATAQSYIEQGNFYWNSGMFCFKVSTFLSELETYAPEVLSQSKAAISQAKTGDMTRIGHDEMMAIPSISVDYAVMEKSKLVRVVPSDIDWSDLGSFEALDLEVPKDENGNSVSEKVIARNSNNNLFLSDDRIIAAIGLNDMIVIDTPDAILISPKGQSQEVKGIVEELKKRGSDLHHAHRTVHRPWGAYTVLEDKPRHKIKRIVVKPGQRISLQKHMHRSEHWIVISGTAVVTLDDKETLVRPNESTYIPMGGVHRLENKGKIDCVIVEVQVGEYTGEDDIIRIEDDYRRV